MSKLSNDFFKASRSCTGATLSFFFRRKKAAAAQQPRTINTTMMIHQALLPLSLEPEPEAETEPEADASVGTATQSVLAVEPIAPAVCELAGHGAHASAPAAALKVSAAHWVTDVPEPVWPASATQALSAVEPVAVPVPLLALQTSHCV